VKPFVELRDKKLSALVRLSKAADWLHLLEVMAGKDFRFALRLPLRSDIDFYEVASAIGEKKLSVVMDPQVTLQPNTRRDRNIPSEMAAAGAKVVLIPRRDSEEGHRAWIKEVGELVRFGLDRQVALAAVTQEAANVLGLGERLGSIAPGRDANLVFWNGDPFEPGTRVEAVMLEGEFVFEEEQAR
jgi:imidazolonepropionase-like amidohydrolase